MTNIQATLHLKTGETKQFVSNCGGGDGKISLAELHKSSVKLQQEINQVLTALVEEEKAKVSKSDVKNVDDMEEDEEEEEDDEEDENEISPPDEKRQKT